MKQDLNNSELIKIVENLGLEQSEADKIRALISSGNIQDAVYRLLPYINSEIKKSEDELEKVDTDYKVQAEEVEKDLADNKAKFDEEFDKYYFEEFEKVNEDIEKEEKEFDEALVKIYTETKESMETFQKEYSEKVHSDSLNDVRGKIDSL